MTNVIVQPQARKVIISESGIRVVSVAQQGPRGLSINVSGAWAIDTEYEVLDLVSHSGSSYVCSVLHTSAALTEPGVGANWETVWQLSAVKGEDGREVELQSGDTAIQWRYVGDVEWTDLVALADLKGDKGDPDTTQGDWSGFVEYVENKSLPLCLEASFSGTITALKAQSGTGTCVLQVHKNGIALGDSLAITEAGVTVSEVTIGAFAVSDKIDLVVTDNNICTDLSFTVQYVRD
jgi:hypothetical protein